MSLIENLLAANGMRANVVTGKDSEDLLKNLADALRETEGIGSEPEMDLSFITPRKALEFSMTSALVAKQEFLKGHDDCYESAKEAAFLWRMISEQLIAVDEHEFRARMREPLDLGEAQTRDLLSELRLRFGSLGEQDNAEVFNDVQTMLNNLDASTLDYRRGAATPE